MPVLTRIGTNSINDNAVTAAKIPDGAVVADIADDAITGAKFANDIAISTTGNIATTGSGTLTVAGATNLASVATGTLAPTVVFPSGHLIKKTFLINAESGDVGGNNSTPQSYVTGDYTTLLASSASYLEIVYYSSASITIPGYGIQNYYITATTGSHTTTYAAGNLIRLHSDTTVSYRREIDGATALWDSWHLLQYFGADPYPNTDSITSWSAGAVLRFQIYGSTTSGSGDVQLAKDTYWRGFWVNEYKI